MKKYLLLFFIISSCSFYEKQLPTIDSFVSMESSMVIKINNVGKFKSDLTNNEFLKNISTTNSGYNFKEQFNLISSFKDNSSLIICLIDTNDEKIFQIISKDSLDHPQITHTKLNGFNIYSNSKKINLKNNNGQLADYNILKKSFEDNTSFSMYINSSSSRNFFNTIFKTKLFQSHNKLGLNIDIYNKKILLNGISINSDTIIKVENIFNNSIATKSKNHFVVPEITSQLINYTNLNFNDLFISKDSIKNLELESLININTKEVSETILENKRILILRKDNSEKIKSYLSKNSISNTKYRDFNIFNLKKLSNLYNSKLDIMLGEKILVLNNYILISDNEDILKKIIDLNLGGKTLDGNNNFKYTLDELSSTNSLNAHYLDNLNFSLSKLLKFDIDLENYSFQLVKDEKIFHFNAIFTNNKITNSNKSFSKIFDVKLSENILSKPIFVKNHITKKMDIIVQDVNNNIYQISGSGKIQWKKKLEQPILGNIQQVDLYKNGRLQLLFNTKNKIYILDRNGKDVAPFPKVFKDPITLPVSVFDYDKNKNYRILVTQNSELLMYDKKGKKVSGFKYSNTKNKIITKPKHLRILNKDYIVFKTNSDLKILNRKGRVRIKIKGDIKFSNHDIFDYDNMLTTTTKENKIVSIENNGSIKILNNTFYEDSNFNIYDNELIINNDNKIWLNSISKDLPFGDYDSPNTKKSNNSLTLSLYDNQSKNIFIFNKNLETNKNFPIYSLFPADFNYVENDAEINVIIVDKKNTISLYKINR